MIARCCALLCLIFFTSCYEAKKGCLDVTATNYDVSSDDPCDNDCCTYPVLKLTVSHRKGENVISYDSTYTNSLGQDYSLKYAHLLLSNARLLKEDGSAIFISDKITLDNGSGEEFQETDDFISFTPADFRYEFGEWIGEGDFVSLDFDIGLPSSIDSSTTASESDHLINKLGDSLLINDQYASMYISLDSILSEQNKLFKLGETISIKIPVELEISRGFDVTLELNVDYSLLFEETDFTLGDQELLAIIQEKANDLFILRE